MNNEPGSAPRRGGQIGDVFFFDPADKAPFVLLDDNKTAIAGHGYSPLSLPESPFLLTTRSNFRQYAGLLS
jgi:hypothetical protein